MCLSLNKIVGCFWNGEKSHGGMGESSFFGVGYSTSGGAVSAGSLRPLRPLPTRIGLLPSSLNLGFAAQTSALPTHCLSQRGGGLRKGGLYNPAGNSQVGCQGGSRAGGLGDRKTGGIPRHGSVSLKEGVPFQGQEGRTLVYTRDLGRS